MSYSLLSSEPKEKCSFTCLQTQFYSEAYLRSWSSRWTPAYSWTSDGIVADPINVYFLTNAIIVRDSFDLFCREADGSWDPAPSYSSIECQDYSRKAWPSAHNLNKSHTVIQSLEEGCLIRDDDGLIFPVLWHSDHNNYWHFTFDIAFRVFYLAKVHPFLLKKVKFIVVGKDHLKSFQVELLTSILGYVPEIVYAPDIYYCKKAIYIPPVQTLVARQAWLNMYGSHISSYFLSRSVFSFSMNNGDRVDELTESQLYYVDRGNASNPRQLTNHSAIHDYIGGLGFATIDPGSLSVCSQVNLFSRASLVVGLHGSAFVNMLYMRSGATVVELTNSSYDPFHDFLLARQLGLRFIRVCTHDELGNRFGHRSFAANLSMLKRCISLLMP